MPASGVTVPLDVTPALPPPAVSGLDEASAPMTAIFVSEDDSGSTPPLFFSSTVPSSASCRASVTCAALVAVSAGDPAGGSSNRPNANISVSTGVTMEFSVAVDTAPDDTALCSALPNSPSVPGMSWSRPALADAAVACVAYQSEVTKPPKPNCWRSTVDSR